MLKNNGFDSLGFYLIGIYYLFQMIGAIFGPSINNKLGLKVSFFLGGFSLALFVFVLILPAWRAD